MKRRGASVLVGEALAFCMVLFCLTGCGGSSGKSVSDVNQASTMEMYTYSGEAGLSNTGSDMPTLQDTSRKLIKTVDMTVETKEYDAMLKSLNGQIEAFGGYVESMSSYNGSIYSGTRSSRNSNMKIRIPAENLNAFLDAVESIGNVIRRNDGMDDVTQTYVDIESHKKALETEQERLLELLEEAESLEDILTIEDRLANVRYQLESMESQLRTFDNQVSYSTVNLELEEVYELTPVEEKSVWERIADGFVNSLHSIGHGFVEFFVWLIVYSPFLIVWTVIIVAVLLIVRWAVVGKKRSGKTKGRQGTKKAQSPEAQLETKSAQDKATDETGLEHRSAAEWNKTAGNGGKIE